MTLISTTNAEANKVTFEVRIDVIRHFATRGCGLFFRGRARSLVPLMKETIMVFTMLIPVASSGLAAILG